MQGSQKQNVTGIDPKRHFMIGRTTESVHLYSNPAMLD